MTPAHARHHLLSGVLLFLPSILASSHAVAESSPVATPGTAETPAATAPLAATKNPAGATASPAVQENVFVTGLSRTQKLQTAPATVTVFTARNIADSRIQNVSDFLSQTPNASIVEAQQPGVTFLTIDGLAQVRNGQSPVATIVDGIQEMDARQFQQDLFDIDQIEVLQGPQGDLWGRNAIGGAIVVNTKEPTDKFHAFADGSIGNGPDYRGKFGVSGPIIRDRLLYDIEYSERNFEGLLQNVFLNKPADYYDEYAVRAHVRAILADNLTIDFRAGVDETYDGGNNYQLESANYVSKNSCFLNLANPFGATPADDANLVNRTFCAANLGRDNRDIRQASMRVTYTQPWATITNSLAWLKLTESLEAEQEPYTASPNVDGQNGTQSQWYNETAWEDELRLTSPSQRRFRWMFGGYFLDQRDFFSSSTGADEGHGITSISTSALFNDPNNPTSAFLANSDHNQDYAVFSHVSYDILKDLTAEFGFRYDWNYENQYVDPTSTAGVPSGCSQTNGDDCRRSALYTQGQPKVTVSYRVDPDLTLYTDYGVGFRSGQFNQAGAAQEANLSGVFNTVKPERANTFEAGFKSQWLGGRLRVNGNFFDTQDENALYFLFVGSVGAQVLVNIDQVRLVGGGLTADYRLLRGLDLFANFGYTHSRVAEYSFNSADVGKWAPYVPQFTGDAGIQYRTPITERVGLFGRADAELHGKQYWDPENSTARNSFTLYNLKAGFENLKGKWAVTMYVNNLLDTKYNAEYVDGGFVAPAEPRMFGGEVRFNY